MFTVPARIVLFAVAATSACAFASGDTPIALAEVVVTGTRTEKNRLDAPVRTEVISHDDITRQHARDLKQALENTLGLSLEKIHGKTGYEVWMQGVTADRVLVLIDGENIGASTGSSIDVSQIGIGDIERIEVVKGATSTLYGSAAIGGIVNVITRKPMDALELDLRADVGSYGEQNPDGERWHQAARHASGQIGTRQDRWYAQLAANYNAWDGFQTKPDAWDQNGPDGYKLNTSARAGYTPDETLEWYVNTSLYQEDVSYRYSATTVLPGKVVPVYWTKSEDAERVCAGTGILWKPSSRFDGSLRFYRERMSDDTEQDNYATTHWDQRREPDIGSQKLYANGNLMLDTHLLTFGIEHFEEYLDQVQYKLPEDSDNIQTIVEIDGESRDSTELYLQDDIAVGALEILPGARYQHDSDFGGYVTPKLNLRYDFADAASNRHFVLLGIGRGYRVPNLKERHYIFDHSQYGYLVLGNPQLDPEHSNSAQLSWTYAEPDRYEFEASLFYNDIKDLIDVDLNTTETDSNGNTVYRYRNFGHIRTQGGELKASHHIDDRLRLRVGYALLDARDLDADDVLPGRPRHQFKLGINWTPFENGPEIVVNAKHHAGEYAQSSEDSADNQLERSDSYEVYDLKLSQRMGTYFTGYGGVSNLTNTQKDFGNPADLRPEEGRFAYAGFRFTY